MVANEPETSLFVDQNLKKLSCLDSFSFFLHLFTDLFHRISEF